MWSCVNVHGRSVKLMGKYYVILGKRLECTWILVFSRILGGILQRYQGWLLILVEGSRNQTKFSWTGGENEKWNILMAKWTRQSDWMYFGWWCRAHRWLLFPIWWLWTVSGSQMPLMGKVLAVQAGESKFRTPVCPKKQDIAAHACSPSARDQMSASLFYFILNLSIASPLRTVTWVLMKFLRAPLRVFAYAVVDHLLDLSICCSA